MTELTARDLRVLRDLCDFSDNAIRLKFRRKSARPMDVGGRNGSHHGATLAKLHALGLAECDRWLIGTRHTNYYRISDAGRKALERHETEATP